MVLLAIGAFGQLELQACALDRWAAHRMVSPSRSTRSSSSFVQYTVLSSERENAASLKMQPRGRSQNGQHVAPRKAIYTNIRGIIPFSRSSTQAALLDMRCSRRESCSRVYTCFSIQGPWAVRAVLCCATLFPVPSYTRTSRSP